MGSRREFDIPFVGLKPGVHHFEYEIGDDFFSDYGTQDFDNCKAQVKLSLEKSTGLIILKFDVGGQLDVICDRCGNTIGLQLWDEFKVLVKLVDDADKMNEEEADPDIYYLNRTESFLNVRDWVYEFINLSIPSTHVCKPIAEGGKGCNQEVLQKLEGMQPDVKTDSTVWKGLDKIKGLGN